MSDKKNEFSKKAIVGDWKIVKLLGSGGQGSVWKVIRHRGKSPPRALKACFAEDATARARFEREVRLLEKCASDHVLPLISSISEWKEHVDGLPAFAYYISELCNGTLEDERAKYESIGTLIGLFRQACKAVTLLHSRDNPVIHRDLKPANFLSASEPQRIVIADFGIAKEQNGATQLTETNEVVGSRFFRAPEVLNGSDGDESSDVYSMGKILEWLVTGSLPQKMGPSVLPRGMELANDACDALDSVLAQATATDPKSRFKSVADLEACLPKLWLSVRSQASQHHAAPLQSAQAIYDEATALARQEDWIGWRELEGSLRVLYPEHATQWRSEFESNHPQTKQDFGDATTALLKHAEPRFVLALVGCNSWKDAVSDQTALLDDLVEIEGWRRNGMTLAINGPRTMIYLFHYLHGALCMHNRRAKAAMKLAKVPLLWQGTSEVCPLWQSRDITAFPELLGADWKVAWEYLLALYDEQPFIKKFFPLKRDFEVGLAGYSMLLSLLELAFQARNDAQPDYLEVLPIFSTMGDSIINSARQRVFANVDLVREVAGSAGVASGDLASLWPQWVETVGKTASRLTNHQVWGRELELGSLAII